MHTETIPLEETDCFSTTFINYLSENESLKSFYGTFPAKDNFSSIIESRSFPEKNRKVLSDVLAKQYDPYPSSTKVQQNIASLADKKTFTITTGHQLNIFTGPLYFIYKIITVINTCKELGRQYPDYNFVPIYWMASEDHDFEEISFFHFQGEKITWDTEQTGAVGRFNTLGLEQIAKRLPSGASFFSDAYQQDNLADAVRRYVNHLFGEDGLVVVDADHTDLKRLLVPIMEEDLFRNVPQKLVSETSLQLENQGINPQVYPRDINFFYLDHQLRERIERIGESYQVLNTDLRFSEEDLKKLLQSSPEKFSPNVILRPIYQEIILPNLAYVGGPSELVYWLQLKSVFDHFAVPFPALMPRNFATIGPSSIRNKWNKIGLATKELFAETDFIFSTWVKKNSLTNLDFKQELLAIGKIEEKMKKTTAAVDATLNQHIEAITRSFERKIEKAEKKLLRAEKRRHHEIKTQIEVIKESLFPGGSLQERKTNFLNFYLEDPKFIQKLKDEFDPFNYEMYLLYS